LVLKKTLIEPLDHLFSYLTTLLYNEYAIDFNMLKAIDKGYNYKRLDSGLALDNSRRRPGEKQNMSITYKHGDEFCHQPKDINNLLYIILKYKGKISRPNFGARLILSLPIM